MVVPAAVEFSETVASTDTPVGVGATSDSGNTAELVPIVAVMCAVVSEVTLDVATWKLPLLKPAETLNVDGMRTFEMSLLRETDAPAVELSVTIQVEGAGGITESGVHEIPVTVGVDG